jgi:hypothetical protein
VLKALLAVHRLYLWDYGRFKNWNGGLFDGAAWLRQGQAIYELARAWVLAPHRKAILGEIVRNYCAGRDANGKETVEFQYPADFRRR